MGTRLTSTPCCARLAAALALAAVGLAAPSAASAEILQGTTTQSPAGGPAAPSQDIVGAAARYDTNGSLTVSATMNGNIAAGPATFFSFAVGSYAPPATCTGPVTATLYGYSTKPSGSTLVTGYPTATAAISVSGNTITFSASGAEYANKPFSCMTLSAIPEHEPADQLNPPLWFQGFGPAPGSTPNQSSVPTRTSTAAAPTVLAFASTVAVKLPGGLGSLTARCGAPSSESCTFSLTLFATLKNGHARARRVAVGTVSGKLKGGRAGKLVVRLNTAGRKLLRHGTMHVEANGTVRGSAGLVTRFHRRLTIKRK